VPPGRRSARIAARILAAGDVFVPKTMMLGLEWVLRFVAEQPAGKVADCLVHLIALPGVTIEDHDEAGAEGALRLYRRGIAFAAALHLAASQACSELLTFADRRFARRAAELGLKPPARVPTTCR